VSVDAHGTPSRSQGSRLLRAGKRRANFCAAILLAAAFATTSSSVAAVSRPLPTHDSFYRYSGDRPLASIAPGTVLKTRPISLAVASTATPVSATQLLYRTTDQLGHPMATVTTVLAPLALPILPRVVGYLSFYDGLGSECDPSYTLAGGDPGAANESEATEEELLMAFYAAQGWVVTVPDYEGPDLHWMAGREEGYATLDALRATRAFLKLSPSTPFGLSGYSGGAVAADWASELAPHYAPKLNLVGVAEGGVPVDYAHLFSYINGDKIYGASMPGTLLGLARAYGLNLGHYLSAYGEKVVDAESEVCIGSVFGDYPGLTYQKLFKPRYRDVFGVPAFARILNDQLMGSAPGHPIAPLMMGVGDSDGFGDGVMRDGDVESLAREYCRQGVAVEFHRYGGAGHEAAGAYFEPETVPFLQARFAGLTFKGNCGSIPHGDSLAPLAVPPRGVRV
jgi:acetyl esterase/lipase